MDEDRAGRCTRCGILDNLDVDGNCGFCMADLFNLKRASDVPTGQIPSAKNLVSFPPFSWRIVKNAIPKVLYTTLELTFQNRDVAVSALSQLQELRRTPVKAVAVDTNEECETASQAHTGTKK